MLSRRRMIAASALGALAFGGVMPRALAQATEKLVRMIVGFPAGGGTDVTARVLAEALHGTYASTIIVENKAGASARLAVEYVKNAPPDGSVMLFTPDFPMTLYPHSFKSLSYDPLKDFIPVAPLTSQPYVLVVGNSAGITTVAELIALAKAKPGQLRFGSAGVGAGNYVGVKKFNLAARIEAVHVPPGPGDGITDVIASTVAGRTDYLIAPIPLALADIRSGNLRPLGVTTMKRSALLPEVPTIAESGVAGFDYPIWYGVWVPAGTPAGVVDKLAKDIARVLAAPDLRDQLAKHGADPMSMTQPEFAHFVLSERESAARIIKAAGIKPQ